MSNTAALFLTKSSWQVIVCSIQTINIASTHTKRASHYYIRAQCVTVHIICTVCTLD